MSRHYIASKSSGFSGHGLAFPCALGKGGLIAAADKREGDGASPIGAWPVRRIYFRPDRIEPPHTDWTPIKKTDGWCDAPGDARYNRPVSLPYPASSEKLWREDHVYDLIVELGYNDDPVMHGHGSAIFMHVARPAYEPTEGCVALAKAHLLIVLGNLGVGDTIEIAP